MKGKYVAGGLVGFTLIFGAALYYANQYAYCRKVSLGPELAMPLGPKAGGAPVPLSVADFQGIAASSSPIRFRAFPVVHCILMGRLSIPAQLL